MPNVRSGLRDGMIAATANGMKHILLVLAITCACTAKQKAQPDASTSKLPDASTAPDGPGMPKIVALTGSATPDQISCAMDTCDTTTKPHCCGTPGMTPTCTATCSEEIDFSCDGPEDCPSGQLCCATPSMTGIKTTCAASCTQMQAQLCHNATQCPSATPTCCGPQGGTFGSCSMANACQ